MSYPVTVLLCVNRVPLARVLDQFRFPLPFVPVMPTLFRNENPCCPCQFQTVPYRPALGVATIRAIV